MSGAAAKQRDAALQLHLGDHDAPQKDLAETELSPGSVHPVSGPTSQCAALVRLHAVLILIQVIFAGQQVLVGVALAGGRSQLVYTVYRNIVALSILGPCAYAFDKGKRPPLTPRLLFKFFMLGLTGIVGGQQLFLVGLVHSSPLFASTMQNAVPVVTFLLAYALGLERVRLFRRDGAAKVAGTAVCVAGAVLMSLYRGNAVFRGDQDESEGGPLGMEIQEWQVGGAMVLVSCLGSATYLTIQVPMLKEGATPLTTTAFTYAFGTLQILAFMLVFTSWRSGWAVAWNDAEAVSIVYAGIMTSAVNFSLQTWAIQKGGSVLVALYYPMQSVCVAVITVSFLGEPLRVGTLLGGVGEVAGLYLVTWGQVYDRRQLALDLEAAAPVAGDPPPARAGSELEKPLLTAAELP